jgi:hypothetical protein
MIQQPCHPPSIAWKMTRTGAVVPPCLRVFGHWRVELAVLLGVSPGKMRIQAWRELVLHVRCAWQMVGRLETRRAGRWRGSSRVLSGVKKARLTLNGAPRDGSASISGLMLWQAGSGGSRARIEDKGQDKASRLLIRPVRLQTTVGSRLCEPGKNVTKVTNEGAGCVELK